MGFVIRYLSSKSSIQRFANATLTDYNEKLKSNQLDDLVFYLKTI